MNRERAEQDAADLLNLWGENLTPDIDENVGEDEPDPLIFHAFMLGLSLAVRYPGYSRELSDALTPALNTSPLGGILDHFIEAHAA